MGSMSKECRCTSTSISNRWKRKASLFTSTNRPLALIVAAVGAFLLSAHAATVTTDRYDYSLWSTALITGSGFGTGETVELQVLHADGRTDTDPDHDPWQVTADPNGGFTSSW